MRYEAKIRAYDMFDMVHVVATVYELPAPVGERPQIAMQHAAMLAGKGEEDPRKWLRDALLGLI